MTATILQLSDTHLRRRVGAEVSGRDPDARLAAVLSAWAATGTRADLVLLTGDDADDGSAEAYARLHAALGALGAPVLAIPGNHDVAGEVATAFPGPATAEVGGWRVIGLDSSRPNQVHGTVDVTAALDRLDGFDQRPTVVAVHHPPVSRSSHPYFQLDGAEALLAGLGDRPHVRALVTGHLHDPFEFEGPGSMVLLGCPSTLVSMAHEGDRWVSGAGGPTGARVLHLADDGTLTSALLAA